MAQKQVSLKQIGLDKTNSRIVTITSVAAFLVVFFLVASYMLFTQMMYQNKVIGAKRKAATQLEQNIKARDSLVTSYEAFVNVPQNALGGNPDGTGPQDGNNAKLVLDALPSKYDFPALAASLEKVAVDQKVGIRNITGTDDEVAQTTQQQAAKPAAVEIPFEMTVVGNYQSIQGVIGAMNASIRPFQLQKLQITGDQGELTLTLGAKTFYQPESVLNIRKEVVK